MTKYHINNSGEVGVCRAKNKCRFGGQSGVDNHFENKKEAEKVAQENFQKKYAKFNSGFSKNNTNAREALKKMSESGITVNKVSSVLSEDFNNKSNNSSSVVDVLDEKPSQDFLNDLNSGKLSFSKLSK